MTYPKLIKNDLKTNLFEYDGGDLWVRENVSYWDDQDYCWNNDILKFIVNATSIKEFFWKINYTIPYESQIKDLKDNQKYKIREDNSFYSEVIKYSEKQLDLVDDILLYDPEILVKFINKLENVENIYIALNMMSPSDIFMDEDDDWIQQGLKNPDWNTAAFDPSNSDDLDDIKYIKENVDPNIKFDFSFDEKQMQILKENKII
tara:strand:- start:141 stop:752 length:612 start_codon:yes stop_codon:yes gene_type:complete